MPTRSSTFDGRRASLIRATALLVTLAAVLLLLAGCGSNATPAHRPISMIYVSGPTTGPLAARTNAVADGAKLAVADAHGLAGGRSIGVAVVPSVQRQGTSPTPDPSIAAERVLRDSRTLVVLAVLPSADTYNAAPLYNQNEIPFIQFGSGMTGLTKRDLPDEPDRYESTGSSTAYRVEASDELLAAKLGKQPGTAVFMATGMPGPGEDDTKRLGRAVVAATGSTDVRGGEESIPFDKPLIVIGGAGELTELTKVAVKAANGKPLTIIDPFDRVPNAAALGSSASNVTVYRRQQSPLSAAALTALLAREQKTFGRSLGPSVAASYVATKAALRAVNEVAVQRAIARSDFTPQIGKDGVLKPGTDGDAGLGTIQRGQVKNGRWVFTPATAN